MKPLRTWEELWIIKKPRRLLKVNIKDMTYSELYTLCINFEEEMTVRDEKEGIKLNE